MKMFNVALNVLALLGVGITFAVACCSDVNPNCSLLWCIKYLIVGLCMILPAFIREVKK